MILNLSKVPIKDSFKYIKDILKDYINETHDILVVRDNLHVKISDIPFGIVIGYYNDMEKGSYIKINTHGNIEMINVDIVSKSLFDVDRSSFGYEITQYRIGDSFMYFVNDQDFDSFYIFSSCMLKLEEVISVITLY